MGLITASSINFDLRSDFRVTGYYIYDENEKDVAAIREILVDDESRVPRYVVIEIGGLMSIAGKKILIPWIALKKAGMSRLDIARSEEEIMGAPSPHDPLSPTLVEEESIHWYFKVEPYWGTEDVVAPQNVAPKTTPAPDNIEPLELENTGSDDPE